MKAIVLHLLSIRSRKERLRSLHLEVLFGESMLPFEGRPRRPSLDRSHRRNGVITITIQRSGSVTRRLRKTERTAIV